MTRPLLITNTAADGSEQNLLVYSLTDDCRTPASIAPGRELLASLHDKNEAIIISYRQLKDIDHPLFEVPILGADTQGIDGSKTSAQYEQEIYGLRADIERLEAENGILKGDELTDEQRKLLASVSTAKPDAPEPAEGHAPRAINPNMAGAHDNYGIARDMMMDQNSNTPTAVNSAGDTKATDPNHDAPGADAAASERAVIDAQQKADDAATPAVNPGAQGERDEATHLEKVKEEGSETVTGNLDADQAKPIEDMTKAELVEHAEATGVEIDPRAKKADIVEAIEAARS